MKRLDFAALLSQHARLIEIHTALPEAALLVERLHGREAVNEPFRFEVDCVSTSAHFELKTLVGEELSLRLLQSDGSLRTWHGYCTQAAELGSDGGLARYRVTLQPWLAFLAYRHDSHVFQDVDLRSLCDALFAEHHPQAHWRFDVSQPLRMRSLCIQHRETDLEFLCRLLAEEGLSLRFEHDQATRAGDEARHARHTLVIFDRDAEVPQCAQAVIRFHRADAPEVDDTIQTLAESRQVGPNAVSHSAWDYRKLTSTGAQAQSNIDNGEIPPLEHYDGSGAYRFEEETAATRHTDLVLAGHEARYRRFSGQGSVRRLAEGTRFTLSGHSLFSGDGADFSVLAVEHRAANNLGSAAAQLLDSPEIENGSYRNHFTLQPARRAFVPAARNRPVATPETALVVGEANAPLTSDRDHRIKIQFHWQRGQNPNRAGLTSTGPANTPGNAPGDERSGTWVRVAEWLAGPNWGSHFLPRVGTEVLVEFIDGDIDRPLVVSQLHNGEDLPPFSAGVDAAANHPGVMSGWMSHNHGRDDTGFNQWLTDDAPGQLRTRLATSYAESQLSLGHLIQHAPQSATRGAWRGAGLELCTDGWLVVRAGDGILISSTPRPDASSTQLDVAEALGQLRNAERTARALSDAAVAQSARPLAANAQQSTFIDAIDPAQKGRFDGMVGGQEARKARPGSRDLGDPTERFAQPVIVTEGPDDIGLASPASTLLFAGRHLHATVQQDWHAAAAHTFSATVGEGASWFSHSGGIKSIAAAGSQTIQAHTDAMEILADQSVTVTSSNDEIHILAKDRIVLQAGQSAVTLEGGDITFACPGTFSVKGVGNAFEGPGSGLANLAPLPSGQAEMQNWIEISHFDAEGEPFVGQGYKIVFEGNQVIDGKLDGNGFARHDTVPRNALRVEYEQRTPLEEKPWAALQDVIAAAKSRLG